MGLTVEDARVIDSFLEEHWFEVGVLFFLLLIAIRCGGRR